VELTETLAETARTGRWRRAGPVLVDRPAPAGPVEAALGRRWGGVGNDPTGPAARRRPARSVL